MVKGPCCCEFTGILEFIGMNTHKKYHKNDIKCQIYSSKYLRRGKNYVKVEIEPERQKPLYATHRRENVD